MRDFLIGIFIFLLVPNLYVDSVVFVAFKIQQDYIVKNQCVQKDAVINTCNGHCVLEKQLKKAESRQENPEYPGNTKTRTQLVYVKHNAGETSFVLKENDGKKASDTHLIIYTQEVLNDIFHPPRG